VQEHPDTDQYSHPRTYLKCQNKDPEALKLTEEYRKLLLDKVFGSTP
jgi:hypothetical protein